MILSGTLPMNTEGLLRIHGPMSTLFNMGGGWEEENQWGGVSYVYHIDCSGKEFSYGDEWQGYEMYDKFFRKKWHAKREGGFIK